MILEYGYFMGALGRDKVMLVKPEDLELPSDVTGVLDTRDNFLHRLLIELNHAGLPVEIA